MMYPKDDINKTSPNWKSKTQKIETRLNNWKLWKEKMEYLEKIKNEPETKAKLDAQKGVYNIIHDIVEED